MAKKRRATGIPVTGSQRHVSKTHGTHNGRTATWPHPSDVLDRPPLGGEPVSRVPRWKNRKARKPGRRINPFNYQDPFREIKPGASYAVLIRVLDWVAYRKVIQTFHVSADCESNALAFAWHVAERVDNIEPLEIVGFSSL